MGKSLIAILEGDKNSTKNEDERLASNLYLCSLSMSLNELRIIEQKLNSIEDTSSKDFNKKKDNYEESLIKNDWLLNHCNRVKNIKCINFDEMPEHCGIKGIQTADALIIDCSKNKCYLFEFKNCSKTQLINEYLTGKNSVCDKFQGSKNILNNLSIVGFISNDDLVKSTEVIVVYNKNDSVEPMNPNMPFSKIVSKDPVSGKQSEATSYKNKNGRAVNHRFPNPSSHKSSKDTIKQFGKRISQLGYSSRSSFDSKQLGFTLLGGKDIARIVDACFFDIIDWGDYDCYFT